MSDNVTQVIEILKGMNALQLADLKKQIESTFGVSAAAPVAVAAGPAAAAPAAAAEEKTSFKVELKDSGANKLNVIKEVRALLGLGLKEAKDLVDKAPSVLKADASKEEADKLKATIEAAGGKVAVS
ncbi:MAG: 50S ribosomal protein L7/L12 [Planctomycetes bacterium]|nr:50S ribosomal protein L7/L12 [Planctomycetota bacterium]